MDFPIHIKAVRMGLPIIYLRDHRLAFPNYGVLLSMRFVFTPTNSEHCFSKYLFRGLQYTMGKRNYIFMISYHLLGPKEAL